MSRQTLNLEAAQRGVQFIERVSKQPPEEWPRATPGQQEDLKALLEAVCQSDDLTDVQFDTLFEVANQIELGLDAAKLIAASNAADSLETVTRFFTWLEPKDRGDILADWGPDVIACFPADAAVEWFRFSLDDSLSQDMQMTFTEGAKHLGNKYPEVQQSLAPLIVEALENAKAYPPVVNGFRVMLTLDWLITEAAEAIERAFSADLIDCAMAGDWEVVRKELHVEGMGLPMPEKPIDFIAQMRRDVGVGAFSKEPLHMFGEPNEEAVEKYLETACTAFARSPEGRALLPEGHFAYNVQQFLELGMNYVGVHTENMTPADAEEILLSVFPRKVSMDASACGETVDELVAFWNFCNRVHGIEHAAGIAERIEAIREPFREAMDDPANYGIAKSFFMQGKAAGFDMTTQEGCDAFMHAYNASLAGGGPLQKAPSPSKPRSGKLSLKERKKMLAKKRKGRKARK